jgi:hypothetical protein
MVEVWLSAEIFIWRIFQPLQKIRTDARVARAAEVCERANSRLARSIRSRANQTPLEIQNRIERRSAEPAVYG